MILRLLYMLFAVFLCPGLLLSATHTYTGLPINLSGWTDFSTLTSSGYESARVLFVSSASGNDVDAANQITGSGHYGISDVTFDADGYFQAPVGVVPFATIATAYAYCQADTNDIILLERGGEWAAGFGVAYLNSGAAQTTPHIIASYGASGARPKLTGVDVDLLGKSYIILSGIHWYIADWTTGVRAVDVGAGHYITIEDNLFDGTEKELVDDSSSYVVLRRNIWTHNQAHDGQLFVATDADGVIIEENLFYEPYDSSYPAMNRFGRNIYSYSYSARFVGNIFYSAERTGLDSRWGGYIQHNLSVQAPMRCGDEGSGPREKAIGYIYGNAFCEATANTAEATNLRVIGNDGTQIYDNVWFNGSGGITVLGEDSSTPPIDVAENISIYDNLIYATSIAFVNDIDAVSGISITGNQIQQATATVIAFYNDYLPGTFANNKYYSTADAGDWFTQGNLTAWVSASGETGATDTAVSYTDATRTVAKYHASIGGTETTAAFMTAALAQSRASWDTRLMALPVINYIRAGFDKAAVSYSYNSRAEVGGAGTVSIGGAGTVTINR